MIDFIKLRIHNPDIKRIKNNPLLEWERPVNDITGVINVKKPISAIYHKLTFEINNSKKNPEIQYLNITGSIHKFWNLIHGRGDQNYNDFRFEDIASAIIDFCQLFNLRPESCIIENFEFGVNVIPPIPTPEILQSVINHKGKRFELKRAEKMNYLECTHGQYYLKLYDKGLQYDQGNLLRFEFKTRKMEIVRTAQIQTLADLINPINYERLGAILNENFSEIMFYDYTIPDAGINDQERLILTEGMNPSFWERYIKTNKDNYFKKRNRFKHLVRKYGKQNISEIVGKLVSQKWNNLLNTDPETLQELTRVIKTSFTGIDTSNIGTVSVNLPEAFNEPSNISNKRFCLSCGRDITKQDPRSKFCSAKFVGYEQAHKCRNDNSNPRNSLKNLIERDNERGLLFLFDTVPLFIERQQLISEVR
jgi:hypothetical protein